MNRYSTGIPSSFDPALLCSEYDHLQNVPDSLSHSDDLEALRTCISEDRTRKNNEGVVIQYRAWNLGDVFKSEGEICFGTLCVGKHGSQD